jgi:hypothetical protein
MKLQIIFLILFSNFSFCQIENDSVLDLYTEKDRMEIKLDRMTDIKFEKLYRIWTDYQVIELIKYNDSIFDGRLVNFVYVNDKKAKSKTVSQKIKIPTKTVKKLIAKLNSENIETLVDCSKIPYYPKGFDGKTYTFEIGVNNTNRIYSYWEPENEKYQNPHLKEIQNVRSILNAINTEFNLWKYFLLFTDRLPKGSYSYANIQMIKL